MGQSRWLERVQDLNYFGNSDGKHLPIWTSKAAEDLSVVGSLMSIAFKPLVNSSPLYTRLSSGERMMSLTTLCTAVSVILSGKDDTSLQWRKCIICLVKFVDLRTDGYPDKSINDLIFCAAKKRKMKVTGKLIWTVFSKGFPFLASMD